MNVKHATTTKKRLDTMYSFADISLVVLIKPTQIVEAAK
jgi:hypothetical protein